jgi:hypothetical protein
LEFRTPNEGTVSKPDDKAGTGVARRGVITVFRAESSCKISIYVTFKSPGNIRPKDQALVRSPLEITNNSLDSLLMLEPRICTKASALMDSYHQFRSR